MDFTEESHLTFRRHPVPIIYRDCNRYVSYRNRCQVCWRRIRCVVDLLSPAYCWPMRTENRRRFLPATVSATSTGLARTGRTVGTHPPRRADRLRAQHRAPSSPCPQLADYSTKTSALSGGSSLARTSPFPLQLFRHHWCPPAESWSLEVQARWRKLKGVCGSRRCRRAPVLELVPGTAWLTVEEDGREACDGGDSAVETSLSKVAFFHLHRPMFSDGNEKIQFIE